MSVGTAIQRSFVAIGDAIARVALRWFVTEEKGSRYFHGILSPGVRAAAAGFLAENPGPILEVGCGDGRLLMSLIESSHRRIVGLDFLPQPFDAAVAKRKEQHIEQLDLLMGSGAELPLKSDSLAGVVCVNALNSMPSLDVVRAIMAEMVRVCRPGGQVVLDYRNSRNPWMYFRFKWRRAKHEQSTLAQITCRHADIVAALESLGCRVEAAKPVAFPLRWLAPAVVVAARKEGER